MINEKAILDYCERENIVPFRTEQAGEDIVLCVVNSKSRRYLRCQNNESGFVVKDRYFYGYDSNGSTIISKW